MQAPEASGAHRLGGLLTADQLSERWQVPKSQVYRLARENRIPAIRIGRYYRFKPEAVEEFEDAHGERR